MEFLMTLVGVGMIGGCLLAVLMGRVRLFRRDLDMDATVARRPLSPDDINLSSIRVAGVGGLGMVAVCLVVALAMPAVGIPVGAGLIAGVVMALVLIHYRRRRGVMPSSTGRPGANTMLAIDEPGDRPAPVEDAPQDPMDRASRRPARRPLAPSFLAHRA
jgi:hypothetical protein